MSAFRTRVRPLRSLDLPNLGRVLLYRAGVRLGINPVRRLRAAVPRGRFFDPSVASPPVACPPVCQRWWGRHDLFGWFRVPDRGPPQWHRNPFSGASVQRAEAPWSQIPDFDESLGDIKAVWEASRFDWVLTFAQRARAGDPEGLARLNEWLADWAIRNPPYCGPNWKCGQEASIRVMHLATGALLLDAHLRPGPALTGLVLIHLRRIAPTIGYAIAQDNNHGTSEAAALFIGGTWLAALGEPAGPQWAKQGRRLLEERAARLIEADGSFSQHSVNCHRLMLDTYSLAEHWRRRLGRPAFSPALYGRVQAAAGWLRAMTQPETGDAPVLGANDGARLLPLGDTDYRDHRPSIQLAAALFSERCAYAGEGGWNLPLQWLGIPAPTQAAEPQGSMQLDAGGYSGDELRVTATVAISRIELTSSRESRYYLQCESIPMLEVEIRPAGEFRSIYGFSG